MNIFSLSHLLELANELPDPREFTEVERGRRSVFRLPVRDWDAVRDADHPDREFDAHENAFVEFEIVQWKNTKGVCAPRRVLRGLMAMGVVGVCPRVDALQGAPLLCVLSVTNRVKVPLSSH
jgi:hypothetical protein